MQTAVQVREEVTTLGDPRLARGEGLPGLTWQRRRPVVLADLWADEQFLRQDAARDDGSRTGLAFPVPLGRTCSSSGPSASGTGRTVRSIKAPALVWPFWW